jgi:hypothetical protein
MYIYIYTYTLELPFEAVQPANELGNLLSGLLPAPILLSNLCVCA